MADLLPPRTPCPVRITGRDVLREFRCSDDPLDIFDGYACLQGSLVHASRRWHGQGSGKYGDWLNSRVVVGGRELDYGDDPRVFVANGRICVASNTFSPGFGFRNHLIEISGDASWSRYYLMTRTGIEPGKNWSPFTFPDGVLGFIHSFSPLRVLREIRRETGIILLSDMEAGGIPAEDGDGSGFPAHRGGSNGVPLGRSVIGVGHTTRVARTAAGDLVKSPGCFYKDDHQLLHRPFLWRLSVADLSLECWDFDYEWDEARWIIDPTSLIPEPGGKAFTFVTTEVDRSFVDPTSTAATVRYTMAVVE